jgi:hypothetical protein
MDFPTELRVKKNANLIDFGGRSESDVTKEKKKG